MDQGQQPIITDNPIGNGKTVEFTTSDQSTVLLSLEEMIKNNVAKMENLVIERRKTKEQFEDSFNNNPTYRENAEKAKSASKVKSETKMNILKQPAVAQLKDKLKTINLDIKESKVALSDYLLEYHRLTSATQLELFGGEMATIIQSARLVKSS